MTARLPRRKKILFSSIMVLGCLLLLAVGSEIVLRVRYAGIERITGATEWSQSSWQTLTYFWDQYHPTYGWTNVPGYRSDERVPFDLSVNRQGLRGERDHARRPAEGIRRIAVFGDSCVFGEEVDDDQTVPFYLERRLQGVECLNFGVHGYGLGQMALRLEEEGFAFEPDHVIVVLLLPSDIIRVPLKFLSHNKPVFGLVDGSLTLSNVPVPEASRQPWLLRRSFVAGWMFGRPTETRDPESIREYVDVSRAILERIRKQCDSREIGLTVVTMIVAGTLQESRSDPGVISTIDYMREAVGSMDFDTLDLVSVLEQAFARHGMELLAPLGHWSGQGNRLIAEALARHLAEQDERLELATTR
jgi:hypothetical protein